MLSLRRANLVARYFTFADDTVLLYFGENWEDLQAVINDDLNVYYRWLLCNRLKINIDKTKFIVFKQKNKVIPLPKIKINETELQSVNSIKYLGLVIDVNLNWSEHITYIIKKNYFYDWCTL